MDVGKISQKEQDVQHTYQRGQSSSFKKASFNEEIDKKNETLNKDMEFLMP